MNQEKMTPEVEKEKIIESFFTELKNINKPDEKIRFCLDFMKEALSQNKKANYKAFWEGKNKCLEAFKEDLSPYVREKFWNEYLEINNQAQFLKSLLEKEADFAKEQIEIAIDAIAKDIDHLKLLADKSIDIDFPLINKKNLSSYQNYQKSLKIINTLCSKISSLRKELMETAIRFKEKNLFFKRLSFFGDVVYPQRKELMQKVSDLFEEEVKAFVDAFSNTKKDVRYYQLKEEIKCYQSTAKLLSLNVSTFSSTRKLLASLWDKVKVLDDERKTEFSEKKEMFSKNRELVQEKMDCLAKMIAKEGSSDEIVLNEIAQILLFMKKRELLPRDVRDFKKDLHSKEEEIAGKKAAISKKQKEEVLQKLLDLKNEALSLLKDNFDRQTLEQKSLEIQEKVEAYNLSASDRELLCDVLATAKPLKEINSSSLDCLETQKENLVQVKGRIKRYRRFLGESMLDFEKAFIYQELLEKEKSLFEQIEKSIEKIEVETLDLEER